MDHVRQNFWKEQVHKEELLRIDWHLKYSKHYIKENASVGPAVAARKRRGNGVPNPSSAASNMRAYAAARNREEAFERSMSRGSSGGSSSADLSSSDLTDSSKSLRDSMALPEPMRPPSSKTKELLYDGLSHEGKGRFSYLNTRKITIPHERYEYPLTNSLEYGWKIADNMTKFRPSVHGRGSIIRDSFYTEHGVF